METLNCMKCKYRHEDNGNCTAVGGFCTAVTAAHCPLLRDFLDTGLTPDEIRNMSGEWCAAMSVLNGMGSYDRLRELAKADKNGRCVVLPCKVGDVLYAAETDPIIPLHVMAVAIYLEVEGEAYGDYERISNIGKTVFLTREEAELALKKEKEKFNVDVSQT